MVGMMLLAFLTGLIIGLLPTFFVWRMYRNAAHHIASECVRRKGKLSIHDVRRLLSLPGLGV